jgi:hypothetical protein
MKIMNKLSAAALLLLGGGLVLATTEVQAVDFNISTQVTDLRSDGTNGNPGFNPCVGGARQPDGSCGSIPGNPVSMNFDGASHALLDKDNTGDGTNVGAFGKAGPGAITDNMFGKVSGSDLGPDGIAGTGDEIAITACGKTTSGATLAGLNCGDLRFDPASQGQTFASVPVFTAANTLVTPVTGLDMNTQFVADFCPGPSTTLPTGSSACSNGAATPEQKVEAHVGFNLENRFNFISLPGGTTATTTGTDNIRQVTAVKLTGIGTLAQDATAGTPGPGTGDQVFVANTTWTATSSNNPATGPNGLVVNWHQEISDPDQSGTGSGSFVQSLDGTFTYTTGAIPVISAQYPSGRTQTERSIGLTTVVGESLDFGP